MQGKEDNMKNIIFNAEPAIRNLGKRLGNSIDVYKYIPVHKLETNKAGIIMKMEWVA